MGVEENIAYKKAIGERILNARKSKGLTQARLSALTKIPDSSISEFEKGRKMPGIDSFAKLAVALDATIDQLYFGDGSTSFIEKSTSKGSKIVNCIYELYQEGIINDTTRDMRDENFYLDVVRCRRQIDRLIDNLNQFESVQDTFPDPELYIEQLKGSVAKQINDELDPPF